MKGKKRGKGVRMMALLLVVLMMGQVPAERIIYASEVKPETSQEERVISEEGKEAVPESDVMKPETTEETLVGQQPEAVQEVPAAQPEEGTAEPGESETPLERKDWTNSPEELKLSLERIIYETADQSYSDKSVRAVAVQTEGILDLQALELDKTVSMEAELGFFLQREKETRLVKGGDTFQFVMPSDYVQLTDTTEPVAVMNRDAANIDMSTQVQVASYQVKNNVVTVTFTDVINADSNSPEADGLEIIGRIAFPMSVKKDVLSEAEPSSVKVAMQQGAEYTILLPRKIIPNSSQNTENITEENKTTANEEAVEQPVEAVKPSITEEHEQQPESNDKKEDSLLKRFSRKTVSFSSELGLRLTGDQQTVKKSYKNPAEGVAKTTIQIASNKNGYKEGDTDLGIEFGIDITLDDDFLYQKLSSFENAPDFPKFDANTDAYNKKVDSYLKSLSDVQLPPIIYTYDLGKDITVPGGTPIEASLKVGAEEIAKLTVVKQDDGHCIVTVEFSKIVYNRDSVSAGEKVGLEIDEDALQGDEPVNVGWKNDQLVVATEDYLNEGGPGEPPKAEYKLDKTAPDKVDSPYIDYDIQVEALEGKTLNKMYLEDILPVSGDMKLEVVAVERDGVTIQKDTEPDGPAYDTYRIQDGTLRYRFPETSAPAKVTFKIRMALDQSSYKKYVKAPGGVDLKFSNVAKLKDADDVTKEKVASEPAETEMKMQFMAKDGKPEGMNGLRYSWTLDINTKFSSNVEAYLVDTICWSDHRYDGAAGIQVYEGGKYKDTLTLTDRTDQIPDPKKPYEDLAKANIADVAQGQASPFYYRYKKGDGKEYAVVIIPFGSTYQNKNVKFKYFTDMYLDGMSTSDWITSGKPAKQVTNDAKFIWKHYSYGGIGIDDFDGSFNINKDVNANISIGTKEAGNYDEKTQMMQWKFKLNNYGAHLTDTIVEDVLSSDVYDWDSLTLKLHAYDRNGGPVKQYDIQTTPGEKPGIYYERDQDKLRIYAGELKENEYYEIELHIKVIDKTILTNQHESAAGTLKNSADIKAKINGNDATARIQDVEKNIPNTLIKKDAVGGYSYDTKELKWKTTIDMNHIPINGAVITDDLPIGSSFQELTKVTRLDSSGNTAEAVITGTAAENNIVAAFTDSKVKVSITDGTTADGTTAEIYTKDVVDFKILNTADAPLQNDKTSYVLEYTTVISDNAWLKAQVKATKENPNPAINIVNKASLAGTIADEPIKAAAAANAKVVIQNDKVKKNGKYYPSDGKIRWNITFNQAQIDMKDMVLVEEIGDQPLEIDTESVQLYQVGKNGAETLLKSIDPDGTGWLTKLTPKELRYTIPEEHKTDTLKLVFDTALTKSAEKGDIKNTARLEDEGKSYQDSEESDGGYDGSFDIDNYVKAAKKPVFQIIKISGNNDESSKKPPLQGAEFALTAYAEENSSNNYVEAPGFEKKGTTGEDGKITFVNLRKDYIYKLEETTAPVGYDKVTETRYYLFQEGEFTPKKETYSVAGASVEVNVCPNKGFAASDAADFADEKLIVKNTPSSGMKIEFTKKDPKGTQNLENCEFWLVDTKERLATQKVKSVSSGAVAFEKVDPGEYKLIEYTSVNPYDQGAVFDVKMSDDGKYEIQYEKGNADIEGVLGSYVIKNRYAKGQVKLKKVDDQTGNIPLQGAVFTLKGKSADQKDISQSATSDETGEVTFDAVPYSDNNGYTISETTPPAGYRNDNLFTKTISQSEIDDKINGIAGSAKTFKLEYSTAGSWAVNERTKGKISFTKMDDPKDKADGVNAEPLKDRAFKLLYNDSDGYNGWSKGHEVATGIKSTDAASGNLVFHDIPYGNYKLVEISSGTDDPYQPWSKEFTLRESMEHSLAVNRADTDPDNNNTFSVAAAETITNSLLRGSFTLKKTDASTKEPMQGVTFTLSGTNAAGGKVEMAGTTAAGGKVEMAGTTAAGTVTFSDVPIGATKGATAYELTETRADGYEVLEKYEVFVKPENNAAVITVQKRDGTAVVQTSNAYPLVNTPIKGNITLTKKDAAGTKPLDGAEFTLYRVVDGEKIETDTESILAPKKGTTKDGGTLTFTDVEYGNYIVKETKPPAGYKLLPTEWTITKDKLVLSADKSSFTCVGWTEAGDNVIKNEPTKLKLVKKDQFNQVVEGAKLMLSGTFADGTTTPYEWTTGSGSDPDLEKMLVVGNEYTLKETTPPTTGLYKAIKDIVFILKGDGALEITSGKNDEYEYKDGTLTVIDRYYLAPVELTKMGETLSGGKEVLAAVEFDLYWQKGAAPDSAQDVKMNPGGQPIITDEKGKWNSKTNAALKDEANPITKGTIGDGLSKGTYYFKETKATANHVLDKTPVSFTIGADDFNADGTAKLVEVSAANELVNASVSLTKLDGIDSRKISDTEFTLSKAGDSNVVTKSTDDKGALEFSGIGKGSYTLTETEANASYELGDAPFSCTFEVTDACKDQVLRLVSGQEGSATVFNLQKKGGDWSAEGITNARKAGSVSLVKKGESGTSSEQLEGAVFGLFYQVNDTPVQKDGTDITATTDHKGTFTISDLEWNEYYLKELTAPDGYALDETHLEFVIGYGSISKAFSTAGGAADVINKATKVTLTKQDANTKLGLTGAVFTITGMFKGETESKTRTYDMASSDSQTIYGELLAGASYVLAETTAPEGYSLAEEISFEVTKTGEIKVAEQTVTDHNIIVADKPMEAALKKVSAKDGTTVITGGSYEIAPAEGSKFAGTQEAVITVTDAENDMKQKLLGKLIAGNSYIITEKSAPKGYTLAEPITFTVDEAGEVTLAVGTTEAVADGLTIVLKDAPNKVKIVKQDEDKKTLAGAEFSLKGAFADSAKIGDYKTDGVYWTSTESAYELEGQLIAGETYTLEEKTAADGYQRLQNKVTFTIDSEGKIAISEGTPGTNAKVSLEADNLTITVQNIPTKFYLDKISDRTGADGKPEQVAGAKLAIVKDDNGKPGTAVVTDWTTDGASYGEITKLAAGKYWLKEQETPYGYVTADPAAFELKDNNTIATEGGTGVTNYIKDGVSYSLLTMTDPVIYGQVELTKVEKGQPAKKLSGVEFSLYKKAADGADILIAKNAKTSDSGLWKSAEETITNSETGQPLSAGLTPGAYYFKETKTLDGYLLNSSDRLGEFTVKGDGEAQDKSYNRLSQVTVANEPFETYVTLPKVDSTSGEKLDATVFTLYQKDGETWQEIGTADTNKPKGEAKFTIREKGTYRIQETEAAPGYQLDQNAPFTAEFTVDHTDAFQKETLRIQADAEGSLHDEDVKKYSLSVQNAVFYKGAQESANGTVANERKLGTLTLEKKDGVSDAALSDVQFTLYQKKEGNLANKLADFLTGKQYKKIETQSWSGEAYEAGKLTIKDLAWGEYYIQETGALNGYELPDTKYEFKIGRFTNEVILEVSANNKQPIKNVKTRIYFTKYGKLMESCANELDKEYAEPLAGAEFTAYTDANCTEKVAVSGAVKANPVRSSSENGSKGLVEFIGLDAGKTYYIKETKTPDRYQPNANVYRATLDANGYYKGLSVAGGADISDLKVINDLYRTTISLKKVSEQDNSMTLPGSTYGLYKKTNAIPPGAIKPERKLRSRAVVQAEGEQPDVMEGWTLIATNTTDSSGMLTFEGVLANTEYRIKELIAPEGSHVSEKPIEITFKTVEKDGKTVVVVESFDDGSGTAGVDPDTGEIVWREPSIMLGFTKKDMQDKPLEGAKFELQDMKGNVIATWTSEAKAYVIQADQMKGAIVANGTYQLVEKEAPGGYKLAEPIVFTVEEKLVGPGEQFIQQIVMKDEIISLKVDKIAGDTKSSLAGAELLIHGQGTAAAAKTAAGEQLEWTTDGKAKHIEGLAAGKYVLTESKAPTGYEKAADIAFEIDTAGKVTAGGTVAADNLITMTDEKSKAAAPNSPAKTGDTAQTMLYLMLAVLAAGTATAVVRKKKSKI